MGLPRMDLANLIVKEMALPISPQQYVEEFQGYFAPYLMFISYVTFEKKCYI